MRVRGNDEPVHGEGEYGADIQKVEYTPKVRKQAFGSHVYLVGRVRRRLRLRFHNEP